MSNVLLRVRKRGQRRNILRRFYLAASFLLAGSAELACWLISCESSVSFSSVASSSESVASRSDTCFGLPKLFREGACGSIRSDFVMLDSLGCPDESGI